MKIMIAPSRPPHKGEPADQVPSAVTVEHPYDDLNAVDAARLARMALIAFGYSEKNIEELFGRD